jgi:hypothetical protein
MALVCSCPTVLPNLKDVTCPVDLDQVVKLAFQLTQPSAPFTTPTDPINVVNSWNALAAASDSSKIVFSPAVANVVIPASEGNFIGEDSNESVNGVGYYMGENLVKVTGEIHSAPQSVIDALDELSCYSDATLGASKLTVFMFLRRIKGKQRAVAKSTDVAGSYVGFEVFNFRVSSLDSQGWNSKNKYMFSFTMLPDEFRGLDIVDIDFNPLALVNVDSSPLS